MTNFLLYLLPRFISTQREQPPQSIPRVADKTVSSTYSLDSPDNLPRLENNHTPPTIMQENEEHAELAESDGAAQDKATSGMPPAPFPSSTPDRTSPSIQSPPPQPPSPKTATSSQPDNVVDMVDQNAASTPQAVVQDINPRDVMDEYGWDDLEERFLARMGECRKKEEEINMEFREWLKVCCARWLGQRGTGCIWEWMLIYERVGI